jgi:hypothetical protein
LTIQNLFIALRSSVLPSPGLIFDNYFGAGSYHKLLFYYVPSIFSMVLYKICNCAVTSLFLLWLKGRCNLLCLMKLVYKVYGVGSNYNTIPYAISATWCVHCYRTRFW